MTTFKITFMIIVVLVIIGEIGFFVGGKGGKNAGGWNLISISSFYAAAIILVVGFVFTLCS